MSNEQKEAAFFGVAGFVLWVWAFVVPGFQSVPTLLGGAMAGFFFTKFWLLR